MPVIAVINRKGGSGKSTLATHLAAWCARRGHAVMLGDTDRQQSSRAWLRRRDPALPLIQPSAQDQKQVLKVPAGISHVILDTPGGLHGFELARIVMGADAILMPVAPSVFDRESAAACHEELMALPRVASGRCKIAAIGMRIDRRTHGADLVRDWAQARNLPFLGILRESQIYTRALDRGLTVFDLAPSQVTTDLELWQPIIDWLLPVTEPTRQPEIESPARFAESMASRPTPPSMPEPALAEGVFRRARPSLLEQARADRQAQGLVQPAYRPLPGRATPLMASSMQDVDAPGTIEAVVVPLFLQRKPA